MNAIAAKALTVAKGSAVILDGLDFVVKKGAITGLIGPSGSGKTTLMRSVVGVQVYAGTLKVLGRDAGNKNLRRRIGYVTQSPAIYGDLTVGQNLAYFASIVGAPKSQVAQIIHEVDLVKQKKQLVANLSGGQKARVSLAIALLGDPELLVLDEPTVGLDPILRNNLWSLFEKLAESGKTLLVSSHVMDEAGRCDELLLMRDGKLLWNDSKQKLLTKTSSRDVGDAFVTMIKRAA